MMRFRTLALGGICNSIGYTPSPGPVGKFAALLPVLPVALLNVMDVEERGNRTRKYAYTRVKSLNQSGNSNRKHRWLP